jgi:hypothetical protein
VRPTIPALRASCGTPPWRRSFSLPRRQVITGRKVCPLASPMGTKVPRKRHTRA